MPIYEYSCENCGKITEILVNKEKDDTVCKYCGSVRLKKLISVPGAIIMGSSESKGTTCCGRTLQERLINRTGVGHLCPLISPKSEKDFLEA